MPGFAASKAGMIFCSHSALSSARQLSITNSLAIN
ncbi:Uncharacterised protein [Vibrio cholerae]|nr:Uncharacterised protein [Vibrio cholerae]